MKIWCALVALTIAVVCGINLAATIRRVPPAARFPDAEHANPAIRADERFRSVRDALTTHGVHGTVAYLTDAPPDQLAANPSAMEEYFLAQFALAPWVLDARAGSWRWAVANFHGAAAAERVAADYRVAEDCGNGVVLLEKIAR